MLRITRCPNSALWKGGVVQLSAAPYETMKKRTILSRILCIILTAVMLLGLFAGVFPSRAHAATASQNNIVAHADYLYNIK